MVNNDPAASPAVSEPISEQNRLGQDKSAEMSGALATVLAVGALIAINFCCYFRSLNGYFLADDFIHLPWLARVFDGHPELLLKNFVSNWMQTDGTQFYRPLISLTLAADWALWRANALGYHATNILLQTASSILLFLTSKRILVGLQPARTQDGKSQEWRNYFVALAASGLFAASPLHCEVVSWIIGRVDSVATMFYLAAVWLFVASLQDGNRKAGALAMACFVLSLLSKEIAITMPAAAALYCFCSSPRSNGILKRNRYAIASTIWLWLLLGVYLCVRTAALGTVSGGYTGSIGSGLSDSLFHRWFGDGSLLRVFFPLNAEIFGHGDKIHRYLRVLYQVALGFVTVRTVLCWRAGQLREWLALIGFAAGWFIVSMIPALQVWSLTPLLQGGRFIYLGTAPLSLLFAILVSPIRTPGTVRSKTSVSPLVRVFNGAALVLVTLFVCMFATITFKNNEAWIGASDAVRALREQLEDKFKSLPEDSRIALLNLPQQHQGAHMIYNGSMFTILVQPPLTAKDYSNRIATFEPIMFGNSDLVSASRVRRLAESGKYSVFGWDETTNKLVPLNVVHAASDAKLKNVDVTPRNSPSKNLDATQRNSTSKNIDERGAGVGVILSSNRECVFSMPQIATSDYDFAVVTLQRLPNSASRSGRAASAPSYVGDGVAVNEKETRSHRGREAEGALSTRRSGVAPRSDRGKGLAESRSDRVSGKGNESTALLSWSKETCARPLMANVSGAMEPQTIEFSLSEHKSWLQSQRPENLTLRIVGTEEFTIESVLLVPGSTLVPRLTFDSDCRNTAGSRPSQDVRGVTWVGTVIGPFAYDVSQIAGADHAVYEISQRDFWFDHYNDKIHERQLASAVTERGDLPGRSAKGSEIVPRNIRQSGYYDFRIFAVDKSGKVVGYSSDPDTLWIEPANAGARSKRLTRMKESIKRND